ncbi:type IV secretory system conjugative DNA transfer family protein [Streptomyces sp. NPDC047315]|uniref:type IV secretory system conjugative DNA transfer family protein n=1 Tax=Streptomyces sp. NPDC047315 TaxID=3155142 RepID=UPI0033C39A60
MSDHTTTAPAPSPVEHAPTSPQAGVRRSARTERAIAVATSVAPVVTGLVAPFLDGGAAFVATVGYGLGAGFLAASYMNRLPAALAATLPARDVLEAHRSPLFASTLTTGMALGLGTLQGPAGADALMAGFLALPSVEGVVSAGWWAAVALVPFKLRRILRRARRAQALPVQQAPAGGPAPVQLPEEVQEVLRRWAAHISHPNTGTHRGQELHLTTYIPGLRWTGTITAPLGGTVTVNGETISSVYERPVEWIDLKPGAHTGERQLTVHLVAPPELDPATLPGAWRRWAARKGGLMSGTRLEQIQDDPATGGQVALVVAGEDLDRLQHPGLADLAGALRVDNPLLLSYEPRSNPREAIVRRMHRNPLQDGTPFPGPGILKANQNGFVQIGRGVSGFPARVQLWDPALGAQHVLVAGVTGSGKGGTLQLLALAYHVNGAAIINADPKGSSNPAIEKMAAYSGLGADGAIGALRVWWHGLQWRIQESARLGAKNFKSTADRPWVPLILDEASKLLGERAEHRREATYIINAGATLGRSLGMPVVLANQLLQLAQLGGDAAIRDNVFYGGALILHRSDSQQKHLIDLPESFAGCNPADIPAAWSGDRAMVYDPDLPEGDPQRTFGLAYAASPGAHAEMMRTLTLEDATPHINTAAVAWPVDWPFWEQRHELATRSVLPGSEADDGDDVDGILGDLFAMPAAPKKPKTASEKILAALQDLADPASIETLYHHRDQIGALAGLEGSTLDNTLSRLVKSDEVHRKVENGREVKGYYGLGPAPTAGE